MSGVRIYFDTSALVSWFVADAHTSALQEWAAGAAPRVLLSDFAAAEFAAVVSRAVRMGRFRVRAAERALGYFDRWRLQVEQRQTSSNDVAWCEQLVRDFRLKLDAPDALHLAIARADNVPLVTFDRRLAAASRAIGHQVIIPGE
jgi:predicted nucleic acid-binding protein